MNRLSVYLAAPWFNEKQKSSMDKVRDLLLEHGFDVHAPYYNGVVLNPENDSPDMRSDVFASNIHQATSCDMLVAIIDDFDPGTMIEMGAVIGCNLRNVSMDHIKILAYSDVPGRGLNLMLQQGCDGFANGSKQFRDQLGRYHLGKEFVDYIGWKRGDVI